MNIFVLFKNLNFVFLYSVITKVADPFPSPMTKNLEFFSHVNVCALSNMALRSVIGSSTFLRITRNAAFCKTKAHIRCVVTKELISIFVFAK